MISQRPTLLIDARGRQDGFKDHKNRGIGQYARRLLEGLRSIDIGADVHYLVDSSLPLDPIHDNTPLVRYVPTTMSKGARFFDAQLNVPRVIGRAQPTLVHFLAHDDAAFRLQQPYIVTVHDTVAQEISDLYSGFQKAKHWLVGWFGLRNVERAAFIVADSEHTRKDVVRRFHVDPERIRVVHLAADDRLFDVPDAATVTRVRRSLNLPDRFLLYVGGIDPRKNVAGIVRALASFRGTDLGDVPLLMAGRIERQAEFPALQQLIATEGVADRVRMLGFVDDASLAVLYASCSAFVFPSFYEGFGLPVLEAMASRAPVVTTRRSSIPELGGEAVYYVDPESVGDIARGIREVVGNTTLRKRLKHDGPLQARTFSWDRTVRETAEVYERVFSELRGGTANRGWS